MRSPLGSLLRFAAATCLLVGVASCDDDDPAGPDPDPDPIELPTLYTFDASLEGWTLGTDGGTATRNGDGFVMLEGEGTAGEADAWMSREVILPGVEGLWIDVRSSEAHDPVCGGDGDGRLRITATPSGGAPVVIENWEQYDGDGDVVDASLETVGGQTVTLRIEADDAGTEGPNIACVDEVEIFID